MAVRLLLILSKVHGIESRSVDFVLAFPQADLDVEVYMEIPTGMDVDGKESSNKHYCLRLEKNIYGLKQGSHNWFLHLKQGLASP